VPKKYAPCAGKRLPRENNRHPSHRSDAGKTIEKNKTGASLGKKRWSGKTPGPASVSTKQNQKSKKSSRSRQQRTQSTPEKKNALDPI
jgi:hypothetical protein